MNLVIDSGNTQTKIAVFDKSELKAIHHIKNIDKISLLETVSRYRVTKTIISSVSIPAEEIMNWVEGLGQVAMIANHKLKFPFTIGYNTPQTLGIDRVAAVAGAIMQYPARNLLVVDAGTAITYEVVTEKGIYLGGNIAPGMMMRFSALHEFTARLPLVTSESFSGEFGTTTNQAIASGVIQGIINEIMGYKQIMDKKFQSNSIIITGGDAEFFAAKLKNPIFVNLNLVLTGLNHILEYNV